MLLDKLTRFYKDESLRLPHEKADLLEIGWDLADLLESWGEGSNAWKAPSAWEFDDFVAALRTRADAVLIDIAVNSIHQTLLDAEREDSENLLFAYLGQDIAQYLLRRNDAAAWKEAEAWAEEEEKRMR